MQMIDRVSHCVIFIDAFGKAGIGVDVRDDELLAVFGNPAGDAFAHFQANVLEGLGRVANGDREVEFVVLLVHHQQGPGVGTEVFRHFFHDRLQNGIEIQRRG